MNKRQAGMHAISSGTITHVARKVDEKRVPVSSPIHQLLHFLTDGLAGGLQVTKSDKANGKSPAFLCTYYAGPPNEGIHVCTG